MYAYSDTQYGTSMNEFHGYPTPQQSHANTGTGSIPVMTWNATPAPNLMPTTDAIHTKCSCPEHDAQEQSSRSTDSHLTHVEQMTPPNEQPELPLPAKLSTSYWEDEGTLCYQVEANGICVARRQDNDMVNGTKLLNVVGMSRGKRDGILKNEMGRVVVKVGAMHLKGVWITISRAKVLACQFKIDKLLYPLFSDEPGLFFYIPPPLPTMGHPGYYYPPPPYYPATPSHHSQHFHHDMSMVPAPSMFDTHHMLPYGGQAPHHSCSNDMVAPHLYMNAQAPSPPYQGYQDAYLFDMDHGTPIMNSYVDHRNSFPPPMVQNNESFTEYADLTNGGPSSVFSGVSSDSAPATPSPYYQNHSQFASQTYDPSNHSCNFLQEKPTAVMASAANAYPGLPEYSHLPPSSFYYRQPNAHRNGVFINEESQKYSCQPQPSW